MAKLHLVRHGPVNVDRSIPGAEWQLSPIAKKAIEAVVSKVSPVPTRIVSSPEPKALGTAEVLARQFDLPVEVRDGLEEHHRRTAQFIEDPDDFRRTIQRLFADPTTIIYGSESAEMALDRFQSTVHAIMSERAEDCLIVSHGTVLSLYLGGFGCQGFELWSNLQLPDLRTVSWPRIERNS